ncbi:MAG TPA: cache domain-containing protein [Usitatibacter sp.]|nr:cache domain-containing protein [Usitatibacter sp.]
MEKEGAQVVDRAVGPGDGRSRPAYPSGALPAEARQIALPAGFRLHEYRIDAVLGQGGFGIAYAATDVNLNVRVVIKEYLPEAFACRAADYSVAPRAIHDHDAYQAGLDSFLVEARTLATFRHPNIVRVARFFEANHTAYMVLEFERGQSLKQWRQKRPFVPENVLVELLAPLLDGLAAVHAAGYLHRDIKPDNIHVRDDDGSLVLLDFGSARQTASEKAEAGMVVTPGYGPIEQYANGGRQGPWTDIYSFGATLFWMVTGRKPIDAPSRLADPDPQPRAEDLCRGRYTPQFLRAIDWALAMHPTHRPQDVAQFRSALFATHSALLGLEEALRDQDEESAPASEALPATLRSPHLIRGRLARFIRRLERPGSWPLAAKMIVAMVATALLPMMITAYYNLQRSQQYVASVERSNLEQLATSTAGRIAQFLADSRNLADYVGTDEDFLAYLSRPTPGGAQEMLAKLRGLVNANADIQFAMVMDPAGNALVASDPQVMGRNFGFREYFKEAMDGRPHMTGIIVGSVAGAAGVFYSRPVLANAKVIGAVVLRIKAEPIVAILEGARKGAERDPFLVDADGIVVWHPDERRMFASLVPLPSAVLAQIIADQRFRRPSIESLGEAQLAEAMVGARRPGNVSYFSNTAQREEIAGFAPVPGHGWVVGVSESRDFFAAPLDRLFRNVLWSVAVVGTVFLLVAVFFARSIVRPIEQLTAGAHALKNGDFGRAHIAVRSGDELGQLARTFNVMIDVLRQRERERSGRRAVAPAGERQPPRGDAKQNTQAREPREAPEWKEAPGTEKTSPPQEAKAPDEPPATPQAREPR